MDSELLKNNKMKLYSEKSYRENVYFGESVRLPFGIVAYAFTLFWTTFVETAVYNLHVLMGK